MPIPQSRRSLRTTVGRRARDTRVRLGADVRRLRQDAGVSQRRLAAASGIDQSHLARIESGSVDASVAVLVALGEALGADVGIRLFPTSGARVRDRFQVAIMEAVLRAAHPRWQRFVEVPVSRPVRGVIDAVLASASDVVAIEVQSEIRRVEQQLRWAHEKADALPSAVAWPAMTINGSAPRIGGLLVLRSTVASRDLVRTLESTFRAACPAPAAEAYEALVARGRPWPGRALLWARLDGDRVELLPRPPRGIGVGR